jgi:hypothetical protein
MKGHLKSLSRINTAPIHIVLNSDTPTQIEPSFISENVSLGQASSCTATKTSDKIFLSFHMTIDVSF